MSKNLVLIFVFALLFNCSDDDGNALNETDLSLVTGIDLRADQFSEPIRLGNPNTFNNNSVTLNLEDFNDDYYSVFVQKDDGFEWHNM